jgi:hypothetical protein
MKPVGVERKFVYDYRKALGEPNLSGIMSRHIFKADMN